jgi:hypothetical protein
MLGRLLMLCLAGVPAMGSVASSSSIPPPANTAGAAEAKPDPEALLIDIYKDLVPTACAKPRPRPTPWWRPIPPSAWATWYAATCC